VDEFALADRAMGLNPLVSYLFSRKKTGLPWWEAGFLKSDECADAGQRLRII
jgi:hypothetical protein